MFNIFCPLTSPLLESFIAKGKKYFVRQTYSRGMPLGETEVKGSYLFTHYGTITEAQAHYNVLKDDDYRFLYDANFPEHLEKLKKAAAGVEGFRIYASVAEPGWEKRAQLNLKPKVKRYIDYKLKWKPKRNEMVDFDLYLQWGELFAKLTSKGQEVSVRLEEIEKYK